MSDFNLNDYHLKKNDLCLCGSGLRFKQCCFNYYNSKQADVNSHLDSGDYSKAFMFLNGQLTNYLEKVLSHTKLMLLKFNNESARLLLKIDINAVDETVTRLIRIARDNKLNIDFEKKLQFIGNLLDEEQWKQRLTFLQVLYYDSIHEYDVCRRLLKPFVVENIVDKNLLQIYLQVMSDGMGIGEIEALLNKIIEYEDKKIFKLKYEFALAIHYLFYLDDSTAKKIANSVVEDLSTIEKPKDVYERSIVADIYSFYGQIMEEHAYLQKAIDEYTILSDDPDLSPLGLSKHLIDIGHLYMLLGKYNQALASLERSKAVSYNPLADIYIGDVYIRQKNGSKALDILNNVSVDNIHNKIDYLLTISRLLIEWPDSSKAKQVINEIKSIDDKMNPYFVIALRDSLCKLYESTDCLKNISEDDKEVVMDTLNKAIMLQPNIFGFGLNLNYIFERIFKKKKKE